MASYPARFKVNHSIATVSGTSPTAIVAGASGYAYAVTEIIAANLEGSAVTLNLYEGAGGDKLCPRIVIGASGTLFLDELGGSKQELAPGSGVYATLNSAVSNGVEISVYYITYDERTPVIKSTARNNAYISHGATRKPNEFGAQ